MGLVSRRRFTAGLAVSTVTLSAGVKAQTPAYPNKTIKLVVPYPPGGAADFLGRLLAQKMSEGLGQTMIVENKPGAGTTIAADLVAKAAPDGYTLLQVVRDLPINPSLYAQLPFDSRTAFSWIGMAAVGPYIIVANPSFAPKSMAELVALAKAKPGSISYGSTGLGGLAHINVEAMTRHLAINLQHVPYKGAGPALQAAVSGEVPITIAALAGAIPLIRDGKLRGLVVGAPTRSPQLPDVPTTAEAGAGDETLLPAYFAFGAPAGVPQPIIDKLNSELNRALALPDVAARITQNGLVPAPGTPAELGATVAKDMAHFAKLVKDIGIQPQ